MASEAKQTEAYYLTITIKMLKGDHSASHLMIESDKGWTKTVHGECLGLVRQAAEDAEVISASVYRWGSEIGASAHPNKRMMLSKTYQPVEWTTR